MQYEHANPQMIESLAKLAEKNDHIDCDLYKKFDVKRGLRDLDGKGVLVGLTRIQVSRIFRRSLLMAFSAEA